MGKISHSRPDTNRIRPDTHRIRSLVRGMVRFQEPLARHTTFRIGGPCDAWVMPEDPHDFKRIIQFSRQEGLAILIIGNGSNLLVSDRGFKGVAIGLNSPSFRGISFNKTSVWAGAGMKLPSFLMAARDEGLGGLESLAGIPATLGGALMTNAGGDRGVIGDFVEQIKVIDSRGRFKIISKVQAGFKYRGSSLSRYFLLAAKLRLIKRAPDQISSLMKYFLEQKKKTQELSKPSAGCIFRNPSGGGKEGSKKILSSGRLIELSGLKGRTIGDAAVSTKHANFIVNLGKATARDVLRLMEIIQKKVKVDHGIWLEPEVKIIG